MTRQEKITLIRKNDTLGRRQLEIQLDIIERYHGKPIPDEARAEFITDAEEIAFKAIESLSDETIDALVKIQDFQNNPKYKAALVEFEQLLPRLAEQSRELGEAWAAKYFGK